MQEILFAALSAREMELLVRLDKTDFEDTSAEQLLEDLANGTLRAWRFGDGVLLTRIDGDVLWVVGMAGDGLRHAARALGQDVRSLCAQLGCRVVRCIVQNKVLLALYTRHLGYKPVGTILELNDVR